MAVHQGYRLFLGYPSVEQKLYHSTLHTHCIAPYAAYHGYMPHTTPDCNTPHSTA